MRTCAVCNVSENLQFCGRCGTISYCCREHQKKDWKVHKKVCGKPVSDVSEEINSDQHIENGNTEPSINMNEVMTDIGDLSLRAENPQFMPQWVAQNSITLNVLDEFTPNEENIVELIQKNMAQYGICVIDKFIDEAIASLCLDDALHLHATPDHFKPGQVIKPGREKIRGDEIVWLDGKEKDAANISYVCRKIDTIISKCSSNINNYKISRRTKAMLACYPGNGTAYKCHIDNPSGDGRCITAIYYLNKGWDKKAMGGVLRLYPKFQKKVAEVEPKFNRLLIFYSDSRNPHEVLPAFAKRFAVTIWYFDEEERARALETWAKNMPRK